MNRPTNGVAPTASTVLDKSKDWQMELLMEKLRTKSAQYKNLQEISKSVRMTMLDKRYSLDSVEKSHHQKCLDTLQHCIKVTSLQSMVERLESLTRQLGLKFMVGPSGVELFISSDMFYLEIILDQTGAVRDVKVHHEGKIEQQSCAELVGCLSRQDFSDFTTQLEGFASIYQLNAEKKVKCKAFTALQSLESDLSTLAQLQTFMKEPFNLLHKSPVGILEKRRGGHPMKLTYFVSPYDLLDIEKGELEPITIEAVTSRNLGYSVTVCMEGSAAHKLQTTTLITVNRNVNGKSTPSFAALTSQNSAVIPACFILRLNKPMPMCVALVRQIQQLTELECAETTATHPLLSLLATHASEGKLDIGSHKGLFVTLPDQHHCYFMTENKTMEGVLVHSIPFTHPGHVSQILVILRQQALFNTVISSCVRPCSKQDIENMIMFEVSALSWTHISISLEHPMEETMATAELDLSDISNLQCLIHSPGTPSPPNTPDTASELATKVLNRCLSIPITMRAVIKLWDKQIVRKNHFNGHENFSLPLGSGDPGGHKGPSGGGLSDFGGLDGKIKQEPMGNAGLPHGMNLPLMSHPHQAMFLNESMMASANFPNFQNPDVSILSNMELTSILSGASVSQDKSSKRNKRKSGDDMWKSTKRKAAEDSESLMETSSNDSTSRSTPLSHDMVSEASITTPNSVLGFQSDLELSTLDPTEFIGSSDKVPEFDNLDELGDVEEMLTANAVAKEHKIRKLQKSPGMMELVGGDKSLVPPCVSITPINTPVSQGFTQAGERRPGIEIIPIATTPPPTIPSSITITPISSSQVKSMEERNRDRKSSKSRSEDRNRLEKKRKRRRDESPMGPPEKIPLKPDPCSKPVSVSIKPTESPPLPLITPTSPSSMARKFSASPTHGKSYSPNMLKPSLKSGSSSHQSPKHSPAQVPSSPKHTIPGISSPKSHGTSPKHPSTGSSGKPSMSTLKNAANSPSSKSNSDTLKSKSSGKDALRDKEKKSSFSVSNSNKIKSSSVKLKQLDLSAANDLSSAAQCDGLPSPGGMSDMMKSSANPNQVRNRKGSLSAVIDKLKSAQHCDGATDLSSKSSANRERSAQASGKTTESKNAKMGETKNSEYMVKPSSDGMKITINKTRTKDSSKSKIQPSSGTGSPKTHTGLKPGVNSGPASKKPQSLTQKSSSSPGLSNSSYTGFKSSGTKNPSVNAKTPNLSAQNLSSKSMSKLTGSPKTGTNASSKERPRINKSSSEKSLFSSSRERKSSPTQNREESESDKAFKLVFSKMDPYSAAPHMVEGLMKQLDTNFQIPKLSARVSDDKKAASKLNNANADGGVTNSSKIYDLMGKNDVPLPKYPITLPTSKMFDGSMETKIRNSMTLPVVNSQHKDPSLSQDHTSATDDIEKKKDVAQNLTTSSGGAKELNYPISVKSYSSNATTLEPMSLSTTCVDLSSKFATPSSKDDKKEFKTKDGKELLLDFSSSKVEVGKIGVPLGPPPPYSPSPLVSVHIVKSPAPSPMILPSPHSASPCITDDELMDEAVVGLGK